MRNIGRYHVGINDIPRCNNDEELKELANNIMEIAHTYKKNVILEK